MFTSADKALVSLIMAVLSLANLWAGFEPGANVTETTIGAALSLIWPILVWAIPNLPRVR